MSLDQNIIEDQDYLVMTYRWYEPYHKTACIFLIIWSILSAILFHEEFIRLVSGQLSVPKSAAAMALFTALWMVPVYWMLVLIFNRTIIQLTRKEMEVWHGPLPCFAENEVFPLDELRNIWLEDAYPDAEEGEGATHVIVILRTGEERRVIKNIKNSVDSEMIRDRINAWLKKTSGSSRKIHRPMPPSKPVVNDLT